MSDRQRSEAAQPICGEETREGPCRMPKGHPGSVEANDADAAELASSATAPQVATAGRGAASAASLRPRPDGDSLAAGLGTAEAPREYLTDEQRAEILREAGVNCTGCNIAYDMGQRLRRNDALKPVIEGRPYGEQSAEWRAGYDEAEHLYHQEQTEMRRELRTLRGRPEAPTETCGEGNVDNTTCILVKGHDGVHYDGIGYWAGWPKAMQDLQARDERLSPGEATPRNHSSVTQAVDDGSLPRSESGGLVSELRGGGATESHAVPAVRTAERGASSEAVASAASGATARDGAAAGAVVSDTARIDWLDADADRLENVFGMSVRATAGETLRQLIDAEMKIDPTPARPRRESPQPSSWMTRERMAAAAKAAAQSEEMPPTGAGPRVARNANVAGVCHRCLCACDCCLDRVLDRVRGRLVPATDTPGQAEDAEDDLTAAALEVAIALAEEGWAYASEYFREKWGFAERVAKLRRLADVTDDEPLPTQWAEAVFETAEKGATDGR